MQKNHLAAAVAGAILTLSAAANAAVVDVGSDKTLTYGHFRKFNPLTSKG